MLINQGLYWSC